MKQDFKHILKNRLKELPLHSPENNNWENIEKALDWENSLATKLEQLPLHQPDSFVWETIVEHISTTKSYALSRNLKRIAVAASIAIIITLSFMLTQNKAELIFETETILSESSFSNSINYVQDDPINTILAMCKSGNPICKTSNFEEKIQLYSEIDEELNQLEIVMNNIGESSELIQSIIKMENMKSNTLQELIMMIHS